MIPLFAETNINADLNPGTLDGLAAQTHGVEVIVVASLTILVGVFLYFIFRFYREARNYDLKRDESLTRLTEAIQKYTAAADARFEIISDGIERLETDLTGGLKELSETVKEHSETIEEHGGRLDGIDEHLEEHDRLLAAAPAAKKPRPKRRKQKESV